MVQEMSFKDISYLELWQPFVQWSGTICANLVEGIMRNNSVNYFEFRRRCCLKDLSGALTALSCLVEQNHL